MVERERSKGYCPGYISETQKIRDRVIQYCKGQVLDLGCGPDKIKPDAYGVDGRPLPGVDCVTRDIYHIDQMLRSKVGTFDAAFSSHFLEHIPDPYLAVTQWISFLKPGGFLVLYLPDTRYYDDVSNPEHVQSFTYEVFVRWFQMAFPRMKLIEHGLDVGPDKYSFFLVAQK